MSQPTQPIENMQTLATEHTDPGITSTGWWEPPDGFVYKRICQAPLKVIPTLALILLTVAYLWSLPITIVMYVWFDEFSHGAFYTIGAIFIGNYLPAAMIMALVLFLEFCRFLVWLFCRKFCRTVWSRWYDFFFMVTLTNVVDCPYYLRILAGSARRRVEDSAA